MSLTSSDQDPNRSESAGEQRSYTPQKEDDIQADKQVESSLAARFKKPHISQNDWVEAISKGDSDVSLFKRVRTLGVLLALALVLSSSTIIFGSLPLRLMRVGFGRGVYIASNLMAASILVFFNATSAASVFLLSFLLIGIYSELQLHGASLLRSCGVAVAAASGALLLALASWARIQQTTFGDLVSSYTQLFIAKLNTLSNGLKIDPETLLMQIPSGILMIMIGSLAIAILGEKRLNSLRPSGLKNRVDTTLADFKLPDFFVWFAIVAVFLSFYKSSTSWLHTVGLNSLNVILLIYFFQGLAVVSKLLSLVKLSSFWKIMTYTILILQLFLLVGLIGFLDVWFDFRRRLVQKLSRSSDDRP